jgi:co-chaperonin GroES (HSP10)
MDTKLKMRGNNVLLQIIQRKPQRVKGIELAGHLDREIDHALVRGVGPGLIGAAGGRADTFDIREGDYVMAHMRQIRKGPQGQEQVGEKRVAIVVDDETLSIVDQSQIIAIVDKAVAIPADV